VASYRETRDLLLQDLFRVLGFWASAKTRLGVLGSVQDQLLFNNYKSRFARLGWDGRTRSFFNNREQSDSAQAGVGGAGSSSSETMVQVGPLC
jgi:hypothetical protein